VPSVSFQIIVSSYVFLLTSFAVYVSVGGSLAFGGVTTTGVLLVVNPTDTGAGCRLFAKSFAINHILYELLGSSPQIFTRDGVFILSAIILFIFTILVFEGALALLGSTT
jgi:hypothetical protein